MIFFQRESSSQPTFQLEDTDDFDKYKDFSFLRTQRDDLVQFPQWIRCNSLIPPKEKRKSE